MSSPPPTEQIVEKEKEDSSSSLYYAGYDIEKEANERVYPVFEVLKSPTLKEAINQNMQIYHKNNVQVAMKIREQVVGLETRAVQIVYPFPEPITNVDSIDYSVKYRLEQMEQKGEICKAYDYQSEITANAGSNWIPYEKRTYSPTKFKYYTIERAEADGVLSIKCMYCSKTFKTNRERHNHSLHTHGGW